jgi:hypothetical protein
MDSAASSLRATEFELGVLASMEAGPRTAHSGMLACSLAHKDLRSVAL